jgi:hypothetical protein
MNGGLERVLETMLSRTRGLSGPAEVAIVSILQERSRMRQRSGSPVGALIGRPTSMPTWQNRFENSKKMEFSYVAGCAAITNLSHHFPRDTVDDRSRSGL